MKKSKKALIKPTQKINALLNRFGLVPDRIYGHVMFTVGHVVDTGKHEIKARAGKGLSKLMTQLQIPTSSDVLQLKTRIANLEKRIASVRR